MKFEEMCEQKYRGSVLNEVFSLTRKGIVKPNEVAGWLTSKINGNKYKGYNLSPTLVRIEKILESEDCHEILEEIIYHCVEWDKKSREEKESKRSEDGKDYVRLHMESNPPTEKQIAFINAKGHTVPGNRLEASELIDKIINGDI